MISNILVALNFTPIQTIHVVESLIFLLLAFAVLYLLIFTFAALTKKKITYPLVEKKSKFAVFFPAYNEDSVIINSVQEFLQQDYPREQYDIIVLADHMMDKTIEQLRAISAVVLRIEVENSSKTKALQIATDYIEENKIHYDNIVIMDADNIVDPDFLTKINNAFAAGCQTIQTHRVAKNLNSDMAYLDAISEEINNSIFRKGHTQLHLSASLIGSGMAFTYPIFKKYIRLAHEVGFDKQLEMLFLHDHIFIDYLEDIYTYDEKLRKSSQFSNQRRRWMANQVFGFSTGIKKLPMALKERNWDYCNKLLQWTMLPRLMLVGFIFIGTLLMTIYDVSLNFQTLFSLKWWYLLIVLLSIFYFSFPTHLKNKKLTKAFIHLPQLFIQMIINLFRLSGAFKRFIHTDHSDEEEEKENSLD